MLALALHRCHSVTVTLLGDRSGQLFQNALVQRQRMMRMAQQEGVPCHITYLQRQDDTPLGHLEQYFFGGAVPWEGETEAMSLYEASTAYTEVEYVSAQIRQLVRQGYRYRDIAVASRSMEIYAPLLESICSAI